MQFAIYLGGNNNAFCQLKILLLLPTDLKARKNKSLGGSGPTLSYYPEETGFFRSWAATVATETGGPTAQGTLQGSNATQSAYAPGRGLCFIAACFWLLLVLSLFKQGSALQESQPLELCFKDSQISALKVPAHHLGFDSNGASSPGLPWPPLVKQHPRCRSSVAGISHLSWSEITY